MLKKISDSRIETSDHHQTSNVAAQHQTYDNQAQEDNTQRSTTSPPIFSDHTHSTNSSNSSSLYTSGGGSLLSNTSERSFIQITPTYFWCCLEHPAAPLVLALIVLLLLLLDLGSLVSHSLIIPFLIWEFQHIIASHIFHEGREEQAGFIEAALILCGINKNLITRYIWISKLLKDLLEDFAMYIITIVILQYVIGFSVEQET